MRRNGIRFTAVSLTLALLLAGCGNTQGTAQREEGEYQVIELTMAVNGTDTQIDARVADYFAELVEERSGR